MTFQISYELRHSVACLVAQSCTTLWDPRDCSPPGSSVHRISQARILEWVAMSFSRGLRDPGIQPVSPALAGRFFTIGPPEACTSHHVAVVELLSRVGLFATPRTVACQAPLSVEFSRRECWSELPFPPPGDLLTRGLISVPCISCTGRWLFTPEPPRKLQAKVNSSTETCFSVCQLSHNLKTK